MSEPEGKKHKTQRVGAIAAQHKQEMLGLLDPAEAALQQLKLTVEESKDMEEQTSHVEKELKEEIEEKMKRLEKEIKARKAKLLKEVSSIAKQKRQCLTLQRESFVAFQEQIERLVQKIREATGNYRNHEVLSLQGLLQIQLKKQLQVFQQLSLHLDESSVIPNDIDMTTITAAVRSLGRVSCGSSPDHSMVSVHIPGAIRGRERQLLIKTLDETDRIFELAREDVKVKLRHKETGNVIEAIAEYKDESKQYFASVIPQDLGDHELMVTVRNRPVQGAPFPMWVREPTNWSELSTSASLFISSSEMGGNNVYGLALHANGNLYVTENDYVRIIDMKTSKTIATNIGKSGSGDKEFNTPEAIAIHGDYMYIADSSNHRIQKLSALHQNNNKYLGKYGEKGNGDKQLDYPRGICFDPYGTMYVSDYYNHRIAVFENNGNFREIKHPQIKYPWGIAFDPQGNLHVVSYDSSVRGVNIFTPEGHHLQPYGGKNLTSPSAIAIDEESYSFVVEHNGTSSRLQVFDPQHNLIKTVPGFNYSDGVTIARDGIVLIGDRNNCCIRKASK
jgi:DNA-binding beta-propeller fold protein YncE